jgi:polyisoprenoid-binding protein YceI
MANIWTIDPTHSEVEFKVKHLVITTVTGRFNAYTGSIEASDDSFVDAKVAFEAQIDSISTGQEQRDGHLKSADFFDAATYPTLTFASTGLSKKGDGLVLAGQLTMRGVSKDISLDVDFGGMEKDLYGQIKAGFEVTGKINRKDFGLTWGTLTEAGGAVVSDEVRLVVNVQFTKQV